MASKAQAFNKRDTVVVPVISLEEMPQLTDDERKRLISELKQTETAMKAGAFEVYSPQWLRQRFLKVFGQAAE